MSRSLRCAQVADWLLELLPVWEVPVTVSMLRQAIPDYSGPTITGAFKRLVEAGYLYSEAGSKDQVFYFPVGKKPVCLIQTLICKGKLDE